MILSKPKTPEQLNFNHPLLRWTIGGCSWLGVEILIESIRMARQIYSDFELAVCFNNLNKEKIQAIRDTGVKMIDQKSYQHEINCELVGCLWALIPTRLNPSGYELFLDNDIVMTKRLPQVDLWLNSDSILYAMSSKGCRNYGHYDKYVPAGYCVNTGCFGLPPHFDFRQKINDLLAKRKPVPKKHHNFQGIVAASIMQYPIKHQVAKKELQLCRKERDNLLQWSGIYGTHFITANSTESHTGWELYKKRKAKI